MRIIYAHEHPDQDNTLSIFLAGPSPRGREDHNWRPEALRILSDLGFNGTVYVPLPRDGEWANEYDAQVEWELKYLEKADAIAFWVPRHVETLPGFTTNVEFGLYVRSGKIVLGYPQDAAKMKYLDHVARKFGVQISNDLSDTLARTALLAGFRQFSKSAGSDC